MGNRTSKTDRKNQTITYSYDNLDRLTRKQYPDQSGVDYVYDNLSRLTEASDATGTYAFGYDNLGRLTGTTTDYSFLSAPTLTNSYNYDAASNRVSMTDPESGVTSYTYDTLNRLTGLTDFNSHAFGFGYDSLGRRTSMTRANGVSTGYTYDNLSRLLSVLHQISGVTRDGATYTYDNVGNRLSKTFVQQADPDPISVVASYSYDNIYQLTQTLLDSSLSESFSYDDVGNRTASLGLSPYLYNDSNHLTSTPAAGFNYDNNGNTTSKTDGLGTTSYTWDYENRLLSVSVPGTGTVTFAYDPFGRRILKSSGAGTAIYAYDGDNVIEELDASGGVISRYAQGLGIDEPLAMYRNSTTSYYHADGLGSVTALTDSSGTVDASYVYDSFGNLSSSSGTLTNNFRYTGREFDPETGLYYYRARYYDPGTGRFLSEDPIGFAGGDENLYRHVFNSPIRFTDPFGLKIVDSAFPANCLKDVHGAIRILRRAIIDNPTCNRQFCRVGDGRSLEKLLDEVEQNTGAIELKRDPDDLVIPGEGNQVGYTLPGDKTKMWLRPYACRMGRWFIAFNLVHELTHITLTPGDGQEALANALARGCVQLRFIQNITVTP